MSKLNLDNEDLAEFLKKVEETDKQLRGLVDGTLAPEDVKIPGNSWAYTEATSGKNGTTTSTKALAVAQADEQEREKSRQLTKKWDAERSLRLAAEERKKWWTFAKLQYGAEGVNGTGPPSDQRDDEGEEEGETKGTTTTSSSNAGAAVSTLSTTTSSSSTIIIGGGSSPSAATTASSSSTPTPAAYIKKRGPGGGNTTAPIDYSWWDKWVATPDDPASKEEREREARDAQKLQDEAFEKANPDFAAMVKGDIDKRATAEEMKKQKADILKQRGNAAYAQGKHAEALAQYHDSLKAYPFNPAVLNNIAACHVALQYFEGVQEFTSRVIFITEFIETACIKALFRRAHACLQLSANSNIINSSSTTTADSSTTSTIKAVDTHANSKNTKLTLLESAFHDLTIAAKYDPTNVEVQQELLRVKLEVEEARKEAKLNAAGIAGQERQQEDGEHTVIDDEDEDGDEIMEAAGAGAASEGSVASSNKKKNNKTAIDSTEKNADRIQRIAKLMADATASSSGTPSTTASFDIDSIVSDLRYIAKGLAENEDDRVVLRSAGLLQSLCDAVIHFRNFFLVDAGDATATATSPSSSSSYVPVEALPASLYVLAAATQNAKNRLIIRTSGALAACCDILSVKDTRMQEVINNREGRHQSKTAATTSGARSSSKKGKKTRDVSSSDLNKDDSPVSSPTVVLAALLLFSTFSAPCGEPEGRLEAVSHPFFSGLWRDKSDMGSSSRSTTSTSSTIVKPSTSSTASSLSQLTRIPIEHRVDLYRRLQDTTNVLMENVDLPRLSMEIATSYLDILRRGVIPDSLLIQANAAAVAEAISASRAKGSGIIGAAITNAPADPHTKTVSAHASLITGFSSVSSIDLHPVTICLHLLTLSIGRAIFDNGALLVSPFVQACVCALSNLAQIEVLRPAFAAPATSSMTASNTENTARSNSFSADDEVNTSQKVQEHAKEARKQATKRKTKRTSDTSASPPSSSSTSSSPSTPLPPPPALHPLLDLQRIPISHNTDDWDAVRGTSLAALANACIGNDAVVSAIAGAGAADVLLGMMEDAPDADDVEMSVSGSSSSSSRNEGTTAAAKTAVAKAQTGQNDVNDGTRNSNKGMAEAVKSRVALLLGRISGAIGTESLADPSTVIRVTRWLSDSISATEVAGGGGGGAGEKTTTTSSIGAGTSHHNDNDNTVPSTTTKTRTNSMFQDLMPVPTTSSMDAAALQDGLVRILAAATSSSTLGDKAVDAFVQAKGISTLVRFMKVTLPTLANSSAISSSATVLQQQALIPVGTFRSRGPAIGNACKIFISISNNPASAPLMLKASACDVLVETLKSAKGDENTAVRKNAAVAVAKLAKHPACMERIRDLRGMEILMQMSGQLLG